MKFVIILTFLMSYLFLHKDTKDLIGTWECYHRELEDGTTKSSDSCSGEEYEYACGGLIIKLKSDFTGSESIGGSNFKYQRKDSILVLGNRKYVIEKLTSTELVTRDYNSDGLKISTFRTKFKKIK